jgi:acetyl esterase/lipase
VRKVAALAVLGLGAFIARRYLSIRTAMAAVPAELRSPLMLLTFPSTARALRLVRPAFRLSLPSGPGVKVTTRQADGVQAVSVRVTTPAGGGMNRPAVLWIHGGGMVVGSPQFESQITGHLARELDAVVVSPDYRLAPEHPFPAPLDDCMTTLRWMRSNADDLGIDARRIAVGGASAGGGLAAAVAQRSHDEGIALRAQVIIYGMLDDRTALAEDYSPRRGRFVLTPPGYRFAWAAYLGCEPQMSEAPSYSAPSRRIDLAGLPPAWVGVGDLDLLYPENVDYAKRLRVSGVACELVSVPGMYHGADGMAPNADTMREFRRSMVNHLRTYL